MFFFFFDKFHSLPQAPPLSTKLVDRFCITNVPNLVPANVLSLRGQISATVATSDKPCAVLNLCAVKHEKSFKLAELAFMLARLFIALSVRFVAAIEPRSAQIPPCLHQ